MNAQGEAGTGGLLAASPQSEAVTHEMEELSLQPNQNLPPLNERKNVLQLRLQQRRTREQLVDQGIMPPLKSPAAFHEQIRSLERARTENFLKHKIRSRPERAELVRMHILQETVAEPSLQATQLRLKRARLADDLNEKIAQRPGPMELVEKNILPVASSVKEAIIDGQMHYPKTQEFDEDSGDAFSPEQPGSQESHGSVPSPGELKAMEASSPLPNNLIQHCVPVTQVTGDFLKPYSTTELSVSPPARQPQPITTPSPKSVLPLIKISFSCLSLPPPHFLCRPVMEGQNSSATVAINTAQSLPASIVVSLPPAAPMRPNNTLSNRKAGILPANLEEMKVAELKMELKLRGLPVSGTKTDLIERLKPYQESSVSLSNTNPNTQTCSTSMEVSSTTTCLSPAQQLAETQSSTPPVSPISSEVHNREDTMEGQPETHCQSSSSTGQSAAIPEEQDRRLHEKERQIEELLRKLEHEQRLVEKLKMQLEVEKRSGHNSVLIESNNSINHTASLALVKPESPVMPNCTLSPHSTPSVVNLEKSHTAPVTATPLPQFFISHQSMTQVLGQPQTLLTAQHAGTQILLPVSLPNNTATIQLTNNNVKLQPVLQAAVSPQGQGLIQTTQLHHANAENSLPQAVNHNNIVQALSMCSTGGSDFQFGASEKQAGLEMPRCFLSSSPENTLSVQTSPVASSITNGPLNKVSPAFILTSPAFTHAPKSREPPPYEDAVKQTRGLQAAAITQLPTATSQQMDDLFDILIESGEITPFSQQEPSAPKLMPVTASITTLPVNTALSRPPALVQLAPPPALMVEPMPSLASLASDNQLEALLEGTLGGEAEPEHRTLGLLEELQSQLLDQPHSPMDTSELSFTEPTAPLSSSSSFSLQDPGMDGMEWLDLTMPRPNGPLDPLVMVSDFLDTHDLQLHWD
ncbi:Myocardin-related transcription factor B [Bagarius yarrelli]|uniref:Myocardin-related transcription factor B n=1 Tax=Bagarius yarrelli TaxID=175774 RepID=A0A556TIU7_BAGYA|nr:Myocardin-related transcription factor B [Bagarius yarrelli]